MSLHIHRLTGCSPIPLAHYLKALGILRLVSEQADSSARGAWHDEHFELATELSPEEVRAFFLERYVPSPILGPWAARAGFFRKEKAQEAMDAICKQKTGRFHALQEGIRSSRSLLKSLGIKEKAKDDEKTDLIFACRRELPRSMMDWLDTCVVLRPNDAKFRRCFPPILGTGANEGSGSYVASFVQAVDWALIQRRCDKELDRAMNDVPVSGQANSVSLGQFLPNPDDAGNPWDLLLAMEGAVLLSSSLTRVAQDGFCSTDTASPFTTRAVMSGHMSSGDEKARGEQWFPIWSKWASAGEIRCMFANGRARVKMRHASTSIDFAKALSRVGVIKGIDAFERYGYYNRNNIKSFFAVPLGRWKVCVQPNQDLLDDLDGLLMSVQRQAREPNAPKRLAMLAMRLSDAVMTVAARGGEPSRWQDLLLTLANIDACMAAGTGIQAGILTRLRPGWLKAADDGSSELRLALALAAQYDIRRHWLPLDEKGSRLKTANEGKSLAKDPRVVCYGRDFLADAIALVDRRLVESAQAGEGVLNLTPVHPVLTADLRDLSAFLRGSVDDGRIGRLTRALMMLDLNALREAPLQLRPSEGERDSIDDVYPLFRFCVLTKNLAETNQWAIPAQHGVFRRLASGDLPSAIQQAVRHLRSHSIVSPVAHATGDARRLAACMAFPISRKTRDRLFRSFVSTPQQEGA